MAQKTNYEINENKGNPLKNLMKSARNQLAKKNHPLYQLLKRLYYTIHTKNCKGKIAYLREVLSYYRRYEIISFDFFDTLVHRIIYPPERVKTKTAEYACLKLKALGYSIEATHFQAMREEEEKKLREEEHRHGNDYETDIVSIIRATLFKITRKPSLEIATSIIDYEVKNEINHLYLNHEVPNILKKIKQANKKIIVISDMYLLEEHIKQIANHFQISAYIDTFYISSTKKLTKGSGRFYQEILNDLSIAPKKILHIGDNLISDYYSAKKNNIDALYYFNKKIMKRYKKLDSFIKKINHYRSFLKEKLILFLFSEKEGKIDPLFKKKDLYTKISHYFTPVLSLFAYQVLADIQAYGIKKVYFFSREGILLKKIFESILENVSLFCDLRTKITFELIYISRVASTCAKYKDFDTIEALVKNMPYGLNTLSIEIFLKIYGLSLNDLSEITQIIIKPYRGSIEKNTLITLLKTTRFGQEIASILVKKKNLLERYLTKKGLFSPEKIGIIDIGWGGTIQKNLSNFLDEYPSTEFFGFYFGTNHLTFNKHYHNHPRSIFLPGYVIATYDKYRTKQFTGTVPFLESILGCDKIKTTIAYQLNEHNIVEPLFQNNPINPYNIAFQTKIAKRLLKDTKKFSHLFNIASLPLTKIKAYYLKRFYNFIFCPRDIPVKKLVKFSFNYNWSSHRETALLKIIRFSDILKPLQLIHKIKKSPWQYGTLATSPLPGLFILYKLGHYLLHRIPKLQKIINKF